MEELWCDTPDCVYVYLFGEGNPASFKIPAYIIEASPTLKALAYSGGATSNQLQTLPEDAVPDDGAESPLNLNSTALAALEGQESYTTYSPSGYDAPNPLLPTIPKDGHLYFPNVQPDRLMNLDDGAGESDRIIAARNLFAFLMDKPLIATRRRPTEFQVLYSIANHLEELGFFDEQIGDYGLAASTAFKKFMEQFGLQDVTGSNEKILKAVILGERMRSTELYYDAFTHAAGNFRKVRKENATLYEMITVNTRRRLERENHELEMRQKEIGRAIEDFDFPHIFNGSAQSKMTAESRVVRFPAWKQHFHQFRSFVLSYYKHLYGSWPPKANKKNTLTIDGMNRVVLQQLYDDMCVMYDLIVDRDSRTTRKIDVEVEDEDEEMKTEEELEVLALRKIMSEHDRSSLPMSPPIPFDLPRLPSMTSIDAAFDSRPAEEKLLEQGRKLKYFETTLIMAKAHNMDQGIYQPFLQAYASFEQKTSADKSLKELRDMRFGHWLFLYSVLQRLPLLVVDAPNLRYKDGVEYFLCKSPIGPPPWLESSHGLKPHTDEIADNTPEGIFYRSHCWIVGSKMMQDYILHHPPPLSVNTSFQGSPYLGPVDEDSVPDFTLAQYQAGMQQEWQGEPEYMHSAAGHHPQRSDSSATQSTLIANARYSNMADTAIRTHGSSQQRRTSSQPTELYFPEDLPYAQPAPAYASNSAPVSPGGAGIMRPPSRPGSSYFGPVGIVSRPASRQSSRPVSRSGYVDETRYEAYSSALGPRTTGPPHGMAYNSNTPPSGSTESGSVSNPGGSVIEPIGSNIGGERTAAGHSRNSSQNRASRMGPSTFDDILEGMEKGSGKVYEKKAKMKGDKDKKLLNRLSMFGGGGMGGSTSTLGSKG